MLAPLMRDDTHRVGRRSQAGDAVEAGTVLELVEVGPLAAPLAFIDAYGPLNMMGCGRWSRLGESLGVRLVSLGCVGEATVHAAAMSACYVPYACR